MSTWRNWLRTLLPSIGKTDAQTPMTAPAEDKGTSAGIPTPTTEEDGISPQEYYPLAPLKRWTGIHISPYAWDRAVIRSLSSLQRAGTPLPLILAPKPDTKISGATLRLLANALHEMYGVKPDLKHIFQSQQV